MRLNRIAKAGQTGFFREESVMPVTALHGVKELARAGE